MGRGEGAVNSQTLIYILFASVLQDASYLGKKAAHCDGTVSGGCPSLSHWAILFPKAQNSMTSSTIISEKACLSLLFQVWNTLDCPTSIIAFFVSICFVLIFFEATSFFFPQHRWVWQHFRLNRHLSGCFQI